MQVQEVLKMLEDSKIESEEHKAKRLIAKQEMLTAAKVTLSLEFFHSADLTNVFRPWNKLKVKVYN